MTTPIDTLLDFDQLEEAEMQRTITLGQRTITLAPFRSPERAFSYAERCTRPHLVVQGEPPWFWVVLAADAQRLEAAGYEILARAQLGR